MTGTSNSPSDYLMR